MNSSDPKFDDYDDAGHTYQSSKGDSFIRDVQPSWLIKDDKNLRAVWNLYNRSLMFQKDQHNSNFGKRESGENLNLSAAALENNASHSLMMEVSTILPKLNVLFILEFLP